MANWREGLSSSMADSADWEFPTSCVSKPDVSNLDEKATVAMGNMPAAILDCYRPRLVPLEGNITAGVFPFMKVFPAEFCLRRAREEGWITSQSMIVETSSGNMALGLAVVCKLYSCCRLTIVSDYACDGFMRRRLEDLGARVEIVPAPLAVGGYQQARLNRLNEIRAENPDHWWLNQY